jgi:uncharacterized membrane protein YhaH (DUF805 family)
MKNITFADAIQSGLKRYSDFRSVASRAEFWYWVLFTVLLRMVVGTVDGFITGGLIATFISGVLIVPSVSILIRRFRDAGVWAWLVLLWLIPIGTMVGFLAYFVPDFQQSSLGSLTPAELTNAMQSFQLSTTGPIADAINAGVFDNSLVFATAFAGSFILVGLFTLIVTVLPSKARNSSKTIATPEVTDFKVKL